MLLHRCHGLTHPRAPFAVSSNVVVLEDKEDVNYIINVVSRRLGLGLHNGDRAAFVPFTFPPALSDADRRLQQACLDDARSTLDSKNNLRDASKACLIEELGEVPGLAELDEKE